MACKRFSKFSFVFVEEEIKLLSPVQSVKAYEGSDVTLECELSKRTRLSTVWTHNGRQIFPGEKYRFIMKSSKLQLFIENVTVSSFIQK